VASGQACGEAERAARSPDSIVDDDDKRRKDFRTPIHGSTIPLQEASEARRVKFRTEGRSCGF
jgi:hypothetical protein